MKPTYLEFIFDGATASEDAQALASFLATEFPDWPARTPALPVSAPVTGTRDAALTISILALLVALPSGLNDGLDLVQRLQLKTKLERLIAWAKARHARRERNPIAILPPKYSEVKVPNYTNIQTTQLRSVLQNIEQSLTIYLSQKTYPILHKPRKI